ncbi:MAG: VCBS repeat-containing protein, partial [Planctomycetes bacterium]|nr:VCBS repeat-containing protein [Planctomycetota bacterium]
TSDDIAVLLGVGDGTFAAAVHYAAGNRPTSVAIGDLNGDHVPDLAVANTGRFSTPDDRISVLLGVGDGTFAAAVHYAAGDRPRSVAIADLNGDRVPDLAVVNWTSHKVSVLLGVGNGRFGTALDYAVDFAGNPFSLAIGDLDGDEVPDLAVANWSNDNVSVLLGFGNGNFAAAVNYAAGNAPVSIAIGDLNGDEVSDLAVANHRSDNVSVLLGVGDGTFAAVVHYAAGNGPNFVAIGDLDGDEVLDLGVANWHSDDVSVLLKQSSDGCGGFFDSLTAAYWADADSPAGNPPDRPYNCAIDAREPHDIGNAADRNGWDRMLMSFSCDPTEFGMVAGDFSVDTTPEGETPPIVNIITDRFANTATILLDDMIAPGVWTCIEHLDSGQEWCAGYLPGDADQNGLVTTGDLIALVDSINLVPDRVVPNFASDSDRNGVTSGTDILRLIDLLNGAGEFEPWITRSLPLCPTTDRTTSAR